MTTNSTQALPRHSFEIYPEVLQSIAERRGEAHLYRNFDPRSTALVVIDMQNCWLMEGQPGYTPYAPPVVPNINRVAKALRGAGGCVVWVQMNASRETTAKWQRYRDIMANQAQLDAWNDALTPGNSGFELWAGLDVQAGDVRLVKNRYSAFIQGASDIHEELQRRHIDTVMVVGVATNTCCLSTAIDAQMLDYKVIMIPDGNATRSDAEHSAALSSHFKMFGDLLSTEEVVQRIRSTM